MYRCPGCKKRRSLDGGLLCPSCYDAAVAENAKTPSQTGTLPQSVWQAVVHALAYDPTRFSIIKHKREALCTTKG